MIVHESLIFNLIIPIPSHSCVAMDDKRIISGDRDG